MTKDRLMALRAAQSDDEDVSDDVVAVTVEPRDGFMDEFFAEVEEIREMIDKILASSLRFRSTTSYNNTIALALIYTILNTFLFLILDFRGYSSYCLSLFRLPF
jgi:hypothetical protein